MDEEDDSVPAGPESTDWDEELGELTGRERLKRRWARFTSDTRALGAHWFANAEHGYLSLLRRTALVAATLLLFGAIFYFLAGTYMRTGDPMNLSPELVTVSGPDLVVVAPPDPEEDGEGGAEARDQIPRYRLVLPEAFRDRYWRLYEQRFAPNYREGESGLERTAFFERMFPDDVLDQIQGFDETLLAVPQLPEETGSTGNTLLDLLALSVDQASRTEEIEQQLSAYQSAQRVRICRTVQRTRTRYVEGWDYYSTSCPNWYENYGCATRRAVREPYSEQVCNMQFPDDIADPAEKMSELQQRFFQTVDMRIDDARDETRRLRSDMFRDKARGEDAQWNALYIFGVFLALMFLYTIVAIERHQRKLTNLLTDRDEPPSP